MNELEKESLEKLIKEIIVEDTSTPGAENIATTDENLTVDVMFQQSALPSLGRQIFSVLPIEGPTGAIFNIEKNSKAEVVEIPAVAQVYTATPTAANLTLYTLTIDGIEFSYTSDAAATVAEITAGLVLEINTTQTNGSVPVVAVDNTTDVILTAGVAGTPFVVTNTGVGTIGLVEDTPNTVYVAPEAASENIKLVRRDVNCYNSATIKSGLTQEAVQDLRAMHGKEADNVIGTLLRGLANDAENVDTLAFLVAQSKAAAGLALTDSGNAETNLFEIVQKVQQLVLLINSKNLRSYQASVVLPYQVSASIMGLSKHINNDDDDNQEGKGLFIGQINQTKFYTHPDATKLDAYVVLKDTENPSKSSAIFSPYRSNVIDAVDPDDGSITYHIFNRYAIAASPLHVTDNEMIYSFAITL